MFNEGIDRKWVVSAMGNDLTLTADSLLASNPAEAAKQGIAPKGFYNIGDDLDFFKSPDEKNLEDASHLYAVAGFPLAAPISARSSPWLARA